MTKFLDKNFLIKFGILVLAVFLSYRGAVYFSVLPRLMEYSANIGVLQRYYFVYCSAVSLAFLISLIGVSKVKRWGIRALQITCLVVFLDTVRSAGLVSYQSLEGVLSLLGMFLSQALILLCATARIRKEFQFKPSLSEKSPHSKTIRRLSWLLFGALFGTLFISYVLHYYYFFPHDRVTYAVQNEKDAWTYEVLNLSFQTPEQMHVDTLSPVMSNLRLITLANRDRSMRIMINFSPGRFWAKGFHYRNDYEFHRRLLRMLAYISKFSFIDKFGFTIAEIDLGDKVDGFLLQGNLPGGAEAYNFLVCDKENRDVSGSISIYFDKKDAGNQQIVEHIIGSLKLAGAPVKSGGEYIKEAMQLVQDNRLLEAQVKLVNALDQDWRNPEYHYQLALAFLGTGNDAGVISSLQEVIKLDPDYKDAKMFLDAAVSRLEAKKKSGSNE